jgi:branched-chain amino acid aminotransferase
MSEMVYLNGRFVPVEQAAIGVGDVGFLHGGSVFTTLAAANGKAFRLDRHIARLFDSAGLLDIRVGASAGQLTDAVAQVLAANALQRARIRITLSPGDVRTGEPTTLVTATDLPPYPPDWFAKGIAVVVASLRQQQADPTFGHKTGCYFPRILARQEAHRRGAQEALWYTPDHRLAEGCFTNVFLVIEGQVFTPPRDTPVLPGVTRQAIGELCRELEIPHDDEQALTVREMLAAEEMFLTAGTMRVLPVTRIERHAVGDEMVGPVTRKLMRAYDELVTRETR